MAAVILQQILMMSLYMLIGYLLYRTRKIDDAGSKTIANMLAWVVIPSTVLNSFLVDYSPEKLAALGWSFAAALVALGISSGISAVLFRHSGVEQFGASFSNAGFIGIPLIQAALGDEGVFYLVGMLISINLLQWTLGVWLLTRDRAERGQGGLSWKSILLSPVLIASVAGLCLYAANLGGRLPAVCAGTIRGVAALNAPLAMMVLGVYLAKTRLTELFTTPRLYRLSAVRLLLIPLVTVLVFRALPISVPIRMTMLIACAAPVGANVAVFSQLCGTDYVYACKTVTQSTLFSVLTMPLVIMLAERLIGS